jgi:putative ABC transport system substrate-binding protein
VKRVVSSLIILALVLGTFLVWRQFGSGADKRARTVVIVNFLDHPVLNTIANETERGIRATFKESDLAINKMTAAGRVEDIPDIGRNLKRAPPDLVVTISTPVSQGVLRELSADQPVVFTFVTDTTDLGDDLTRTNSTGLSDAVNYAENVKLIQEMFGETARIGFAYNPNEANSVSGLKKLEGLIAQTRMSLLKAAVTSESEVGPAVARLADNTDLIYVGGDNTTVGAIAAVLRSAADKKKVVIASDSGSIEAGAVAGVSVDYQAFGKATADIVVRVLQGENPRSIHRETIAGDSLIVNEKAAKAAGFTIPVSVRQRAAQIIDGAPAGEQPGRT